MQPKKKKNLDNFCGLSCYMLLKAVCRTPFLSVQ